MEQKRVSDFDQRLLDLFDRYENRGLNPHIQDVTRRTALAGFLALGPDAYLASRTEG